jgi:2-haloacid dehalogenase
MSIQAVVFDAYGTLFDVYSIGALAEQLYPGQGAAISVLWRDKQIDYTRLITMSDPHRPEGSRYYQSFWSIRQAHTFR